MCHVSEEYVRWIEIAYSLVRPLVVPVGHEALMARIHPGLVDVRFMEGLDLSDCGWPPYARDDMLDPVPIAELREL